MKLYFVIFSLFFSLHTEARSSFKDLLNYSASGDVFELLTTLSEELKTNDDGVIKKYWISKFGLSRDEKKHLENFQTIRMKYKQQFTPFDKFSLSFYRSKTLDEAVKTLSKVLKEEDLKIVITSLRALKSNAQKIIGESSIFEGKIDQLEKIRKREGLKKTYSKLFKFFSYKSNYKTKVFFTWWPEGYEPKIDFIQNIIFIKISPLADLESFLTQKKLISLLVKSLFLAQSPNQIKNMEKILYKDCMQKDIETSLYNAMGHLYLGALTKKKAFDPHRETYRDKRDHILSVLFFDMFEREIKNRGKFYGNFVNEVANICKLLPTS